MSIKVMALVWDNFPRGGSDKLVMLAMADWCNDNGTSLHPSISTVARKINLSDKQTRVIVHRLIDEGWLSVIGNEFGGDPGMTRQYRMDVEMLRTPPVEVTPPVGRRDPSRGGAFTPPAHGSLSTIDPSGTTSKRRDAPATRLPADWKPSEEDISYLKAKRPDLNITDVEENFSDYWKSQPGAKGRKQDWHATWRMWVRNEKRVSHRDPPFETAKERSRREFTEAVFGKNNEPDRDITGFAERVD